MKKEAFSALILILVWFIVVPVTIIVRKNQTKVSRLDVEYWNEMKRKCQLQLGCYDIVIKNGNGTIPVCECVDESKPQETK